MTDSPAWVPVLVLFGLLGLGYAGMLRGWRRRSRRHALPPLVPVPSEDQRPTAVLEAGARYFGTTVAGAWLDRVVARGLGTRSVCRLALSDEGLDVVRLGGAPFRIPAQALRGARHERGIAGKVVPPHGLLVVTWQHGDLQLDSGVRLTEFGLSGRSRSTGDEHEAWITAITAMTREGA